MRLLLTNDDGFGSEGITVLAGRLAREHEVWIVAPDKNRSGVSHCISMTETIPLVKHGPGEWAYGGTPVDCVIAGLKGGFLPGVPDAVLSGINKGANIGTDVIYSGTASGASQAVLYGVPGIALSVDSDDGTWQYDAMADFAAKNLPLLMSLCNPSERECMPDCPCVYVNVNGLSLPAYKGVEQAGMAFRKYGDSVVYTESSDTEASLTFKGGAIRSFSRGLSDYEVVRKGCVAVSRIIAEPVSAEIVDGIEFSL
jgi:5'-nucleotidase